MNLKIKNSGFSLTEVLMAAGILSIGIMLVATMFPAAIYLTTVASEKTMAAIIADEAFAKMKLYGIDVNNNSDSDAYFVYSERMTSKIDSNEFTYNPDGRENPQYCWSALCKKIAIKDPCDLRYYVKLYVARKTTPGLQYIKEGIPNPPLTDWPIPVSFAVKAMPAANQLQINGDYFATNKINPPPSTAIVDSITGRIFRIISRDDINLTLDRDWDKDIPAPTAVWFLPAGVAGTGSNQKVIGRNPDIDIFERIIDFRKN